MPKENNNIDTEDYLIIFFYSVLMFIFISEPFVFQITKSEQLRMYGYLLFLIGAIILAIKLKKDVKNKNELQIHK